MLRQAASAGHVGVIKDLFRSKQLLDALNEKETQKEVDAVHVSVSSPLALALLQNRTHAATYLIQCAPNIPQILSISYGDFVLFGSHLHLAVIQSNPQIVALLATPLNINQTNQRQETPLHVAVQQIQQSHKNQSNIKLLLEILSILIERGANTNPKDIYNWSPIHLIVKQQNLIGAGFSLLDWVVQKN